MMNCNIDKRYGKNLKEYKCFLVDGILEKRKSYKAFSLLSAVYPLERNELENESVIALEQIYDRLDDDRYNKYDDCNLKFAFA